MATNDARVPNQPASATERPWIEGLAYLKTRECLDLLRTRELGRVGFSVADQPVILPVNYRMVENAVVIRTDPGAKLTTALMRSTVAFEVDDVATGGRSGWSVLVVGHATELTDATSLHEARQLHVSPWVPGSREHFVVISAEQVSGRRFGE